MSRGNNNLDWQTGRHIEAKLFKEYKGIITSTLQAEEIELNTGGLMDWHTGTDAVALIDGLIYGISLRFRNVDYNSFTLSRHINDTHKSEVLKWIAPNQPNLKPLYHVQVNKNPKGLRLIRINIDAFSMHLQHLIDTDQLQPHYREHLGSYEFSLPELPTELKGIYNSIINK